MTIKVVAVFPKGGDASKNDKYVNCVENALGLREWCDKNQAELVVTESKDGKDSGQPLRLTSTQSLFISLHCIQTWQFPPSKFDAAHSGHLGIANKGTTTSMQSEA